MKPTAQPATETARLQWDEQGQPISDTFGDVYFSRANGLAETRYVFLHHNRLPERWRDLAPGSHFTIAETGFGTGLNFLATWQAWRNEAPDDTRLHFISVEKFPLTPADLRRALALWPELNTLSEQLIASYPLPCTGFHALRFDQGRVQLTLMIGDAATCYQDLDANVDAWYLDGFAPAKNPGMWTPALFDAIAGNSSTTTSFSTFTAAALVRQGLQQAGFALTKVAGFGRKRHMLCGQFTGTRDPRPVWHQRPRQQRPTRVTVIGAGMAGAATARALAERGIAVQVIDRGPTPGSEGSGNPQGVLYAKLPAAPTPQGRIHLQGYLHTQALLDRLPGSSNYWHQCGVLQLPPDAREAERQLRLIETGHYPPALVQHLAHAQAQATAGVSLPSGGLWFPGGGWIAPAQFCAALLDHSLIQVRFNTPVTSLEPIESGWRLYGRAQTPLDDTPVLVVACAASSKDFAPLASLPLKSIRGQISRAPAPEAPALQTVLCGQGYVSPPQQGRYCFGATFTLDHQSPEVLAEDHRHNLTHLQALSPEIAAALAIDAMEGRTGFRCATPDYLPLAGPVAEHTGFTAAYAPLRHDANAQPEQEPPLHPGLYVNIGHGSKGLVTAPLCGELVAAMIDGTALPLPRSLTPYLHPGRFIIKDLKRRAI